MITGKANFIWTKRISKEHFQTKDLYINSHSKNTQFSLRPTPHPPLLRKETYTD